MSEFFIICFELGDRAPNEEHIETDIRVVKKRLTWWGKEIAWGLEYSQFSTFIKVTVQGLICSTAVSIYDVLNRSIRWKAKTTCV